MPKILITLTEEQKAALDGVENVSGYIRGLIRKDFKRQGKRFPADPEAGRYERPRAGDTVRWNGGEYKVSKLTTGGVILIGESVEVVPVKDVEIIKRAR